MPNILSTAVTLPDALFPFLDTDDEVIDHALSFIVFELLTEIQVAEVPV